MSNIRGLFIGITSVDIVYNSNEPLPNDNEKVIINDFEMKMLTREMLTDSLQDL